VQNSNEPVLWHIWRLDRDCFGIQNLGARTVTRVSVESERNEVIVMGYIIKDFVRPLEWFAVAIPRELQASCEGVTITCRSGRIRISQGVSIAHAIRQLPSPYRLIPVSDHPDRDVFQPPAYPY
jgi:hypothetical protein